MRKYLGSKVTAFAAIIVPLFICCPLPLGLFVLFTEMSGATVFIAIGAILCSSVWGLYIKDIWNQLYSWGIFTSNGVRIITWFHKSTTVVYEKCKGCGIGFYTHGLLNSTVGTKIYFIYLSYDVFDEHFRSNINLWKPSKTQVKVQFSKNLYDYLLINLPKKQSQMLIKDYKKYF